MGIESRDWYRDKPSEEWQHERKRRGSSQASVQRGRDGRISGGLAAAVLVSAAVTAGVWKFDGLWAALEERLPSKDDRRVVRLGQASGFDVIGPAGKKWCLTVPPNVRVCAKTGTAETGRQALTRALTSRGYSVER